MRYFLILSAIFLSNLTEAQQFYISANATVNISDGATLEIGGNLENDGNLQNLGTLSLHGNWNVNNLFDGLNGELKLVGTGNQSLPNGDLTLKTLSLDKGGIATYSGSRFVIADEIAFRNGILVTGATTQFILQQGVQVMGGSIDSYFQGKLTYRGNLNLKFPVGYQGNYGPITLLNVSGTNNPEVSVFYQNPNPGTPSPGPELIGVSHLGLWELELTNGNINDAQFLIDFSDENLVDFIVKNEIRHKFKSPVIAYSDTPGGTYTSLGIGEGGLINTDSVTFGTVESLELMPFALNQPFFLAIGLTPIIDPEGLYYIPQIFSPVASDPENQAFKIFGEKISEENFKLQIYNKFGAIVYETTSFSEANLTGWTGINRKTGKEEPSATYYYFVKLQKLNGEVIQKKGALYLIR